jgi:hypothetical protein
MANEELWCVHVSGPDDLHPAPSKEAAEVAVWHLTRYWSQAGHPRHELDPVLSFAVEAWPYSAESHAEGVKTFYVDTGTFEGMKIDPSAPTVEGHP